MVAIVNVARGAMDGINTMAHAMRIRTATPPSCVDARSVWLPTYGAPAVPSEARTQLTPGTSWFVRQLSSHAPKAARARYTGGVHIQTATDIPRDRQACAQTFRQSYRVGEMDTGRDRQMHAESYRAHTSADIHAGIQAYILADNTCIHTYMQAYIHTHIQPG